MPLEDGLDLKTSISLRNKEDETKPSMLLQSLMLMTSSFSARII
jgi:hypothetical protein